jgi:hypothetical protein
MSGSGSQFDEVVADTVVVNYFLAVGRIGMLLDLLAGRLLVPTAVYDPNDAERPGTMGLSELEMGLRRHRQRATDGELSQLQRERSRDALPHFESLPKLVERGNLIPTNLSSAELKLYAQFRDRAWARAQGFATGLGPGESAAIAISEHRGIALATDDEDGIRLARLRNPDMRIYRIRGLLEAAVERGVVGRDEARSIHLAMVSRGFWDRGRL